MENRTLARSARTSSRNLETPELVALAFRFQASDSIFLLARRSIADRLFLDIWLARLRCLTADPGKVK